MVVSSRFGHFQSASWLQDGDGIPRSTSRIFSRRTYQRGSFHPPRFMLLLNYLPVLRTRSSDIFEITRCSSTRLSVCIT